MTFAVKSLSLTAPTIKSRVLPDVSNASPDVLLVSHVIGELDEQGRDTLKALMQRSKRIIMVEPGNRLVSRRLSTMRDELLETFHVVAPCPHQGACPSLVDRNDWCHFFATPPAEVFTDGFWARIARELSIDLRSLPYAFLALVNKSTGVTPAAPEEEERLLGRAEITKYVARMRSCSEDSLSFVEITKRHHAKLWRALKKRPEQIRFALRDRDTPDEQG